MKRLITFTIIIICAVAAFADNKALVSQLKKTFRDVHDYETSVSAKEKKSDIYHLFLPDGTEIYSGEWCQLKSVEQYGGRNYYILNYKLYRDLLVNDQGVVVTDIAINSGRDVLDFQDMAGKQFFIKKSFYREGAFDKYIGAKILSPDGTELIDADGRFVDSWTDGKNVYFKLHLWMNSKEYASVVDIDGNVIIPLADGTLEHKILGGDIWFTSYRNLPGDRYGHLLLFDNKGEIVGTLEKSDSFIELDAHAFFILRKLVKGFGGKYEVSDTAYVYSPEYGDVMAWGEGDKALSLSTEQGQMRLVKTGASTEKVALKAARNPVPDKAKDSQTLIANSNAPLAAAQPAARVPMTDVDSDIPHGTKVRPNTFALVIANENYRRIDPVTFAHNDGDVFRRYLTLTLGLPEENVLYVPDASFNDINYNLDRLAKICDAYDGTASVIVYYAGHGAPDDELKEACLLPTDGYAEAPAKSGISLSTFLSALGAMPTQQTVVFIDACFSGTGREDKMLASARGVRIKPRESSVDGNVVVFSASQGDETAHPLVDGRHGLFTYYLLSKLADCRGDVTLGELADFISTSVKRKSAVCGKPQTPVVRVSPSNTTWRDSML